MLSHRLRTSWDASVKLVDESVRVANVIKHLQQPLMCVAFNWRDNTIPFKKKNSIKADLTHACYN